MTKLANSCCYHIINDTYEDELSLSDEDPMSRGWSWWLLQVGTPIIVLFGLPGNVLSFVVMKSRLYRHKSYSHYLSTLAIFDSLVLVGKCIRRLDSALSYAGVTDLSSVYSDAACKLHAFAEYVCYLMCSWLILCMSVERFIAVMFPLRKAVLCRQRNAVSVIIILFASLCYSQIFRLVIVGAESGSCEAADVNRDLYVVLHVYLYQLILQFLLPTVLILAFNIVILFRLRSPRHGLLHREGTRSGSADLTVRKRRKTTCMLMIISFTYLITILPLLVVSLTMHLAVITDFALAMTLFVYLEDLRLVLELISEINYASNFYIYVLTAAHFRVAMNNLFRSKRRRGSCTISLPMTMERDRERGGYHLGSQVSGMKRTSFTVTQKMATDTF